MLRTLLSDFFTIFKSVTPFLLTLVVLKLALRSPFTAPKNYFIGFVLVLLGLFCLEKGVNMCLQPLADDVGHALVRLRPYAWAIMLICFGIGFFATLVEPALRNLSQQVQEITVGDMSAKALTYATAVGSALGMALGIAKVIYDKPMVWFVGPILVLLFVLVFVSKDFYASVAFDCAAATTGPVNIPINAAISLGLATAMGLDPMRVGFGLVGLSCLGAATSVMLAPMATRLLALFVR